MTHAHLYTIILFKHFFESILKAVIKTEMFLSLLHVYT